MLGATASAASEALGRHDGLTEHLVVCQPGTDLGADIGLPDMVSVARHLDVRAQERVGRGQLGHRRTIRDPESLMVPRCGGQVDKATGGVLGRSHTDRGELGVEIQRLVQFAVHRRHDCMAAVRIQGVGECVREHGVRADFDEGVVVDTGGGDGLVESHRVAQVGRPIVGIRHRLRAFVRSGNDRDARRLRSQIR